MRSITSCLATAFLLALTLILAPTAYGQGHCGGLSPNSVNWSFKDSVTACPAGDSVLAGHPSRLRITLGPILDADCNPILGFPPDLIWVIYSVTQGNLRINDQGTKIFADDSTNGDGNARITIPSFSGCGKVSLTLYVQGASKGS